MAKLQKRELFEKVFNTIRSIGWKVLVTDQDINNNPVTISILSDVSAYRVRIYIWNLTHGGGSARPEDEYRIQITGIERFENYDNELTLVLGWWGSMEVFVGYDYTKHRTLGYSPSIQVKEKHLIDAYQNGMSLYKQGNEEIAVVFKPDYFMHYVQNWRELHQIHDSDEQLSILSTICNKPEAINEIDINIYPVERQRIMSTTSRAVRDNRFRNRVVTAYNHSCAACGIQLELIEAAHIIPVAMEGSTDETSNGIALCALHHKAFDKALIDIDDDYRICISETRISELEVMNRVEGLIVFQSTLNPLILLPPDRRDRPKIEYLQRGRIIRNWQV